MAVTVVTVLCAGDVTARALIIEIQLHSAPLQNYIKSIQFNYDSPSVRAKNLNFLISPLRITSSSFNARGCATIRWYHSWSSCILRSVSFKNLICSLHVKGPSKVLRSSRDAHLHAAFALCYFKTHFHTSIWTTTEYDAGGGVLLFTSHFNHPVGYRRYPLVMMQLEILQFTSPFTGILISLFHISF